MDNYKKLFETYVNFSTDSVCLRDVVYEGLKSAIVDGQIRTGSRIVEKRFADQMNISRTPVREALKRLEMEGFIEYVPNVGAIVKCIDDNDVLHLYQVKGVLENLLLEVIVERATEADIQELKLCLKDLETRILTRKADSILEVYENFQKKLRMIADNKTVNHLLGSLDESYMRFKKQVSFQLRDMQLLQVEVEALIEAIESRDLIAVQKANGDKLEVMKQALLRGLSSGQLNHS